MVKWSNHLFIRMKFELQFRVHLVSYPCEFVRSSVSHLTTRKNVVSSAQYVKSVKVRKEKEGWYPKGVRCRQYMSKWIRWKNNLVSYVSESVDIVIQSSEWLSDSVFVNASAICCRPKHFMHFSKDSFGMFISFVLVSWEYDSLRPGESSSSHRSEYIPNRKWEKRFTVLVDIIPRCKVRLHIKNSFWRLTELKI